MSDAEGIRPRTGGMVRTAGGDALVLGKRRDALGFRFLVRP